MLSQQSVDIGVALNVNGCLIVKRLITLIL